MLRTLVELSAAIKRRFNRIFVLTCLAANFGMTTVSQASPLSCSDVFGVDGGTSFSGEVLAAGPAAVALQVDERTLASFPPRIRDIYKQLAETIEQLQSSKEHAKDERFQKRLIDLTRKLLVERGIAFEEAVDPLTDHPAFKILPVAGSSVLNRLAKGLTKDAYQLNLFYSPLANILAGRQGGYAPNHRVIFLSHSEVIKDVVSPIVLHELRHLMVGRVIKARKDIESLFGGSFRSLDKIYTFAGLPGSYKTYFSDDEKTAYIESILGIFREARWSKSYLELSQREVERAKALLAALKENYQSAEFELKNAKDELQRMNLGTTDRIRGWVVSAIQFRQDPAVQRARELKSRIDKLEAEMETFRILNRAALLKLEENNWIVANHNPGDIREHAVHSLERFRSFLETFKQISNRTTLEYTRMRSMMVDASELRTTERAGQVQIALKSPTGDMTILIESANAQSGKSTVKITVGKDYSYTVDVFVPKRGQESLDDWTKRVTDMLAVRMTEGINWDHQANSVVAQLSSLVTEQLWFNSGRIFIRPQNPGEDTPGTRARALLTQLRNLAQESIYRPITD